MTDTSAIETSEVPEGIDADGVTGWFEAHAPGVEPPLRSRSSRGVAPTSPTG